MEKNEWVLQELQRLYNNSTNHNQRTLLKAAQGIINEQIERIEQMEGEVDGTLWSPKRWGE